MEVLDVLRAVMEIGFFAVFALSLILMMVILVGMLVIVVISLVKVTRWKS